VDSNEKLVQEALERSVVWEWSQGEQRRQQESGLLQELTLVETKSAFGEESSKRNSAMQLIVRSLDLRESGESVEEKARASGLIEEIEEDCCS
jgi:hypothetical protein